MRLHHKTGWGKPTGVPIPGRWLNNSTFLYCTSFQQIAITRRFPFFLSTTIKKVPPGILYYHYLLQVAPTGVTS